MPIDTHNDHNPIHPANQEELPPLTELEQQQEWNMELCAKIAKMTDRLKKLAEIEETFKTFGHLTYDEQTEKNEILKHYQK